MITVPKKQKESAVSPRWSHSRIRVGVADLIVISLSYAGELQVVPTAPCHQAVYLPHVGRLILVRVVSCANLRSLKFW